MRRRDGLHEQERILRESKTRGGRIPAVGCNRRATLRFLNKPLCLLEVHPAVSSVKGAEESNPEGF